METLHKPDVIVVLMHFYIFNYPVYLKKYIYFFFTNEANAENGAMLISYCLLLPCTLAFVFFFVKLTAVRVSFTLSFLTVYLFI